ncbi:DUF5789 family protein [Halopenitus persicus]|uniref:DUF2795 domain-containing protein n=1 Tax=Halopenitus persicus TaxID=1048396 RepID=A0A1H3KLA0_9EURY|nr:hypothetical protein [Halopenitus persicus]QHS17853.1 hypothetical protein GWK26_12245 [haloarchaeon 3A1-DGR]SDY52963.1 hypothetical protein SAMN05216564_10666 [Halopenitus persicus]
MDEPERDRPVPVDHEESRSEHVESILAETECLADEAHKYPMRREELATEYADHMMDLPNETESLGSVFDRLVDEQYDSPMEAREAVYNELTGEEADLREYNDERPLEPLASDTQAVESLDEEQGG